MTVSTVSAIEAGFRDRICAVVVTYHPIYSELRELIQAIEDQVEAVILIDNSGNQKVVRWAEGMNPSSRIHVVTFPENRGVGTAQNAGIRWALSGGFSHVLFMDQDSVPEAHMAAKLLGALNELMDKKVAVAAVGPRIIVEGRDTVGLPFVSFQKLWIRRRYCEPKQEACVPADFLISSGMLVPLAVFGHVGEMDEGLFIDNVDLDWCFRAKRMGLELYGVCSAAMKHRLGENAVRLWFGRWFKVYRHEPLRQYYMMRNRISLYRRAWSPAGWIIQDVLRVVVKFLLFSLIFSPRIRNIEMMIRGIIDGLTGKTGKFDGGSPA